MRASLRAAQERIDRASRQLELAAETEARLQAVVEGRSGSVVPLLPSPEPQAAELEATDILLEAELRAAKILSASGSSDRAAVGIDEARALVNHLGQLADIEASLVELASRLVRAQETGGDGASPLPLNGAEHRARSTNRLGP